MQPKLVAVAGPWKGRSFVLSEGSSVIGRDPESDICLDESAISRRHCEITRAGERCMVRDLGSHNHTFVNGEAVNSAEISPGDRIEIGASAFLFSTSEDLNADSDGVELRPEDSVYLNATRGGPDLVPTQRMAG